MPEEIEKILKEIHILIANGDANPQDADNITVNKKDLFELLNKLNFAVIGLMDKYELTQVGKEKALRQLEREGEKLMDDASKKAEEIYAASLMYTDEALVDLKSVIIDAKASILQEYENATVKIERYLGLIEDNKAELNMQLQDMIYGKKYLNLLENVRKKEEKAELKNKSLENALTEKGKENANGPVIRVNENHPAVKKMRQEAEEKEKVEEISDFIYADTDEGRLEIPMYVLPKTTSKEKIPQFLLDDDEKEENKESFEEDFSEGFLDSIVQEIVDSETSEALEEMDYSTINNYNNDDFNSNYNDEENYLENMPQKKGAYYSADDFDLDGEYFKWQEEQAKKNR
ncbi:hypothetical protein SAMN05216249_10677 [Acetitomaculum ruminis DSM 5522]|uniref:Uncharacterized protein n=1 Tax=Acetitomaculum ruminis DSM 5522 TaxID=1120918 RepID=A0A1I0XDT1_9FIRM|nr:hypothetical protein [Acetitomaculum ruminis]SFA98418.1 hypothetical protein SAMN05216249_10677 [Acetitomaculum ruminis DSM 5522]